MNVNIDGTLHKVTHCYACSLDNVIDIEHPLTKRSLYANETLEEIQKRYPGAERMELDEFCRKKAEQQNAPIVWHEITEERYYYCFEALPPAAMSAKGFLIGEPYDHSAETGKPRYTAFLAKEGKFFESSRPLQISEFKTL